MLSRRQFCCSGAIAASLLTVDQSFAASQCEALTQATQSAISPDDALARLKEGNERFVSGKSINCDLMAQVQATANGQYPFAVVIGCIDSRVPPEFVFDQRIGDIFSARVAGNVINDDIVGSAEFAAKLAGAKLIVVLGHSQCGAVKGAVDGAELGKLTGLLAKIHPAIEANKNEPGEHTSKNGGFVQAVALDNAKLGVEMLTKKSTVLSELVADRKLMIVPAMHDVATGRVTFMS
ncbi:carbonic anhydrase family protein [Hyphomicrobium sp.]|uniref:carbonic anhydrase family protein n=1 Tax=Hyphomicrobium sp. TaxID=82 RepID=UPI002D768829|nr:carbonic anhydrase family protein [Hyphomicrobium sp.]HET6389866.1 carbonic anhydrase family protein [Hyphomicrobium sp.]